MSKLKQLRTCAYCVDSYASEEDHVIARQFFPPEQLYRGNLPKVPTCGECNRDKQRCEDWAGVYFQFGHDSGSSRQVLDKRVRRTIQKNAQILRALQEGKKYITYVDAKGIQATRMILEIGERELNHFYTWFCYITKGLYYYESGETLPKTHELYLMKPLCFDEYVLYKQMIAITPGNQERNFANKEFQYTFATNPNESLSMWSFAFKSIEMFAVTAGLDASQEFRESMAEDTWHRRVSDSMQGLQ